MDTRTQHAAGRRWVLPFLAAMVAALAAILVGNLTSASAAGVAETRVGASASVVEVPVGPPERIAAGQRLGNEPAGVVDAVATAVAAKSADDWPVISGIVRDASRSKGNFGLGSGTASQATRAGESWVGDGYRIASDGKTLVSRDGLRVFRPPSWKPNLGKYQANFEYWVEGQVTRKPIGNGHFDVTDMVP